MKKATLISLMTVPGLAMVSTSSYSQERNSPTERQLIPRGLVTQPSGKSKGKGENRRGESEPQRRIIQNATSQAEQSREAIERARQMARERAQATDRERAGRQTEPVRRAPENVAGQAEQARDATEQARQMAEERARQRAQQARERAEAMARRNAEAAERAREMAQDRARRETQTDQLARELREEQLRSDAARRAREMAQQKGRDVPPDSKASQSARERANQLIREAEKRREKMSEDVARRLREEARKVAEETVDRSSPKPKADEQRPLDEEIARRLRGRDRTEGQTRVDRDRAIQIDDRDDAARLITNILSPNTGPVQNRPNRRIPADRAGRTRDQRVESVSFIIERLLGAVDYDKAPRSFHSRHRDGRRADRDHHHYNFHFYFGNHRVVRYPSYRQIPPVLLACRKLGYVQIYDYNNSPYRPDVANVDPRYYSQVPSDYLNPGAYSVSYEVDPNSSVTRDDILFEQGSTALADPLSYDLVIDIAEAILASPLSGKRFVIEGHASAEGSFGANLDLSQRRAERIASDLVAYGVDPSRLIPVGYGEGEAVYPANAAENLRALDRRVTVFRLK